MSGRTINTGDRVRVSFDATVGEVGEGDCLCTGFSGGEIDADYLLSNEAIQVESLEPEPEPLKAGDIVNDHGEKFLLLEDGNHANLKNGRVCGCLATFEQLTSYGVAKVEVEL